MGSSPALGIIRGGGIGRHIKQNGFLLTKEAIIKFFMRAWLAADVFAVVAGKIGETTSRGAVPATPELAHDSQLMATPEHFSLPEWWNW